MVQFSLGQEMYVWGGRGILLRFFLAKKEMFVLWFLKEVRKIWAKKVQAQFKGDQKKDSE